jgi:asparagine synthase (glutamine-hydrolysing)
VCGIAGCYQQPGGRELADAMSGRIAHRGPDAVGLWSHETERTSIHLAHRRLSIIDLSAAADQPLVKGNLALAYNGELYNYRELRAELSARGVRFETSSDTEVVLEAWRTWGPKALPRFRGMFAFAIADTVTGELFLARDRFGIKPLYYMPRGDGAIFASELKAIVSVAGPELRVEPGALIASMLYYWIPEERCSIDGVHKLPPGSCARLAPDGDIRVKRYWSAADAASQAASQPRPDLAAVIEDSVRAHMIADVPVATFLSGGLDSSIITVLARQHTDGIDAYTIAFRQQDQRLEAMPDDAIYARKVAKGYGINLHEIEISPDIVGLLPRIVDTLDEPIGDPAAINTLLMCEAAASSGVKVLLSGMGADELFAGYRKHLACQLASRYRHLPGRGAIGAGVNALPVTAGGRGLRHVRWAKRFLTFAELDEEPRFRRSYTLYDPDQLADLVDPALAGHVDKVIAEHGEIYNDNDLADPVNRMCLADSRLFMAGLNLAYTDRSSMAASVEVRVPFVDPEVFTAAFAIPGSEKISLAGLTRSAQGKVALKKTAERWLPKQIVYRPKASFSAPLRAWVRNDLTEVIGDVLISGRLVEAGLLRGSALRKLIRDERTGQQDHAKQIWQLLSLELWYRNAQAMGVATR